MKRTVHRDAGNRPLDLPLEPPARKKRPKASRGVAVPETQPELPLESAPPEPAEPSLASTAAGSEQEPLDLNKALHRKRQVGGLLDLAVHAAVLATAVAGSWWLGVEPARLTLWPLLVFMACFSFVYHVLPLTFWGHTPGMAGVGLVARAADGGPLTINQSVQRWLGAVVNAASLGILFLLAGGLSLADRFSGSTIKDWAPQGGAQGATGA